MAVPQSYVIVVIDTAHHPVGVENRDRMTTLLDAQEAQGNGAMERFDLPCEAIRGIFQHRSLTCANFPDRPTLDV